MIMTMEQRRAALIEQNKHIKWGDSVYLLQPATFVPIKQRYPSPPSSPVPYTSSISINNAHGSDRQVAVCVEEGLTAALSHHDDARAQDFGDFQTKGNTSTKSPIKMPLASTEGWSLDGLISTAPNTFHHADRVSAALPLAELAAKIEEYERSGLPLVIEGFHKLPSWPKKEFTLDSFIANAAENINARNVHTWTDSQMKLSDFVEKSRTMGPYAQENETERWYGKDMECPKHWEDWLQNMKAVPAALLLHGPQDMFRYRPKSTRVLTLMCYLGIGDTFTPCHKDLCASSGQNLMCYTEKHGSSFWFMTESSVAPKAAQYFQKLSHELDHENHIITLEELANAPFNVYILEQKLGDLVLVPSRSCHQVVNSGGITIKTSWSRMTLKGLITAYHHELPIYRRVCRPEIYKVKSTIFHSMIGQARELEKLMSRQKPKPCISTSSSTKNFPDRLGSISINTMPDSPMNALANDLKNLISAADCILAEEHDNTNKIIPQMFPNTDRFSNENNLTCDFCGADIFQSFFECLKCVEGGIRGRSERLHICAGCYVEGRSCDCSNMQPTQYGSFQELKDVRETAVEIVREYETRQGRSYLAELKLRDHSTPGLFRAACCLYNKRLSATKDEKVCTVRKPGNHKVQYHWALTCKACHNGKCFSHLLEFSKMHAVEALLIHAVDKTPNHGKYHPYHQSKARRYCDGLQELEASQMEGSRYPGYSLLVHNALNYSNCTPVHPRYVQWGFYDNQAYEDVSDDEASISSSVEIPLMVATNFSTVSADTSAIASSPPVNASPLLVTPNSPMNTDIPFGTSNILETTVKTAPNSSVSSSSESADIEMVEAAVRIKPDAVTSDEDSIVVRPPKNAKLVVLLPGSAAKQKAEEDKIVRRPPKLGKPYVLIPPAPYAIPSESRRRLRRTRTRLLRTIVSDGEGEGDEVRPSPSRSSISGRTGSRNPPLPSSPEQEATSASKASKTLTTSNLAVKSGAALSSTTVSTVKVATRHKIATAPITVSKAKASASTSTTKPAFDRNPTSITAAISTAKSSSSSSKASTARFVTARSGLVARIGKRRLESMEDDDSQEDTPAIDRPVQASPSILTPKTYKVPLSKIRINKLPLPQLQADASKAGTAADPFLDNGGTPEHPSSERPQTPIPQSTKVASIQMRISKQPEPPTTEPYKSSQSRYFLGVDVDVSCASTSNVNQPTIEGSPSTSPNIYSTPSASSSGLVPTPTPTPLPSSHCYPISVPSKPYPWRCSEPTNTTDATVTYNNVANAMLNQTSRRLVAAGSGSSRNQTPYPAHQAPAMYHAPMNYPNEQHQAPSPHAYDSQQVYIYGNSHSAHSSFDPPRGPKSYVNGGYQNKQWGMNPGRFNYQQDHGFHNGNGQSLYPNGVQRAPRYQLGNSRNFHPRGWWRGHPYQNSHRHMYHSGGRITARNPTGPYSYHVNAEFETKTARKFERQSYPNNPTAFQSGTESHRAGRPNNHTPSLYPPVREYQRQRSLESANPHLRPSPPDRPRHMQRNPPQLGSSRGYRSVETGGKERGRQKDVVDAWVPNERYTHEQHPTESRQQYQAFSRIDKGKSRRYEGSPISASQSEALDETPSRQQLHTHSLNHSDGEEMDIVYSSEESSISQQSTRRYQKSRVDDMPSRMTEGDRSGPENGAAAARTRHSFDYKLDPDAVSGDSGMDVLEDYPGGKDRATPMSGLATITDNCTAPQVESPSSSGSEAGPKERVLIHTGYRGHEEEEELDWGDEDSQVDASEFSGSAHPHRPANFECVSEVLAAARRADNEYSDGSFGDEDDDYLHRRGDPYPDPVVPRSSVSERRSEGVKDDIYHGDDDSYPSQQSTMQKVVGGHAAQTDSDFNPWQSPQTRM